MPSTRDIQKLALTMHFIKNDDIKKIVEVTGKSERTIYRYIADYNSGKLVIDLTDVKKIVKEHKRQEAIDILDILQSNSYSALVKTAMSKITDEQIDKELSQRGIRNVVGLIGTFIDKRLKSYSIELERENKALKDKLISNGRQIVFMNEGELYASSDELPNRHTEDIS